MARQPWLVRRDSGKGHGPRPEDLFSESPVPRAYRIDPQVAHERARKAALASHTTESLIKRIVDRAPELTDAQRARLAVLLAPVGGASE